MVKSTLQYEPSEMVVGERADVTGLADFPPPVVLQYTKKVPGLMIFSSPVPVRLQLYALYTVSVE